MNTTLSTATEFREQLETNLRAYSISTGESLQRLRQKVASDRFLARIFYREPSSFALKGGYAMELRITQARATKDIDLTSSIRVVDTTEPMTEVILQQLQTLANINLFDHFTFQIGQPQRDIENAPYGGSRHSISVLVDNRPFANFHLDIGCDFLVDQVEEISGTNWLEFCGIAPPIISMISVEQQFAEKLHSYTLPREQINTRTKDLIDLILLLNLRDQTPEVFLNALQRIFRARNTHLLPATIPKPPESWSKPFAAMATECGISSNLAEGFTKVSDFFDRIQSVVRDNN
ncbi:MAG: nucleotidyl transferase AbiEii/AbiGii toxin family protein [Chlamydiales bacterium]|nr:nucleotidyl transferase AbiEii/AbiGii toxin family protein [Chlamydiales bacterium]